MDIVTGSQAKEIASNLRKSGRAGKFAGKLLTKGEITAQAMKILGYGGYICWQQNNVRAVKGRNFIGRKGVPDIPGFNKFTGLFMGCEVKTWNDTLSADQILFLTELTNAGGLALIAIQDERGCVLLVEFKDFI